MTPADAGSSESAAPRGTVLLVEEEQHVRTLLGKYLAEQGYAILEAKNGDEALQQCRAQKSPPINLMICDLVMSEMNGVELAGRARSFHPRMKTLYLSSHSESSVIYRGIPLTDIQFLPKPFKLKELISTVNGLLGHAK
ncbi:MAG TPA: response regulator [Planctomycetota bacterium]|nr:response regulator [Planctomycetota bacterium]